MLPSISDRLAAELAATPAQITAAIALLDEGATVPFIARYRKEATGGLDDTRLRRLEDRLRCLRELEDRRETIIQSIDEQGRMTPALLTAISLAEDRTRLEDLYLPYKPKRRTKAQLAEEAGLASLAKALLANPSLDPDAEAVNYLRAPITTPDGENPGVADARAALDGARQILMERFAEDAVLQQWLRAYVQEHGVVESKVREGGEIAAANSTTRMRSAASPRSALALFRGRREDMLEVRLRLDSEAERPAWSAPPNPCEARIAARFGIADHGRPADRWLMDTVRFAWRVKIFTHLELALMGALRDRAETEAIEVFARNLRELLLAAPAGPRVTMGLDPGLRTGVKVAVVDTATVYPHQPRNDWDGSIAALARSLDAVVEDCVNAVGVDVNTASVPLLTRVSGLTPSVAHAIVAHRDARGRFTGRAELLELPRLGEKSFEQAAGFLRIMDGDDPLDASAVHPESYPLVKRILADLRQDLGSVIGNGRLLRSLDPAKYTDGRFGIPTIADIFRELEKPGRDPRPAFTTATFREGVETLADLEPGMLLEGTVTNVAAFGAFVDIGVHQDGLVHISALADRFVKDPHSVVKAGQVVKVKVLEVDEKRKRIALTMRLTDSVNADGVRSKDRGSGGNPPGGESTRNRVAAPTGGAMAAAFARLKD